MHHIQSSLHIKDLVLEIHLGWTEEERHRRQTVLLNLDIRFSIPPKACDNDQLDDTHCYDDFIRYLREALAKKQFCLIEHLTMTIYKLAKSFLPGNTSICASVTKHPSIQDLSGGVCFHYGDHRPA
jgi:FolB domain-containing protein